MIKMYLNEFRSKYWAVDFKIMEAISYDEDRPFRIVRHEASQWFKMLRDYNGKLIHKKLLIDNALTKTLEKHYQQYQEDLINEQIEEICG